MKIRTAATLKGLIGEKEDLYRFLSSTHREKIKKIKAYGNYNPSFNKDILDLFHYSWFIPLLEKESEIKRNLYLAALKEMTQLQKHFGIQNLKEIPSSVTTFFLKEQLKKKFFDQKIPPLFLLPPSPLVKLLELSKKELVEFIDLLSVSDLPKELSQILDPKLIKTIKSCLSTQQQKFLKTIDFKKFSPLPKLGLKHFEKSKICNLLHERGMLRLSLALAPQPELLFYVAHILDIGRGSLLLKMATKKRDHNITEHIINDTMGALEFVGERGPL